MLYSVKVIFMLYSELVQKGNSKGLSLEEEATTLLVRWFESCVTL